MSQRLAPSDGCRIYGLSTGTDAGNSGQGGTSRSYMDLLPDNSELATTLGSTASLVMYDMSGNNGNRSSSTTFPSAANDVHCSPNGQRVAVASAGTPYISEFAVSDLSKLATVGTLPPGAGRCARYSPDSSLLIVGHTTTPFFSIYDTATGAKLANPATLPAGYVTAARFSPDGTKLYLGVTGTVQQLVYNVADWTVANIPGGTLVGTTKRMSLSPDGTKLAISTSSSPYLRVIDLVAGTAYATPSGLEAAAPVDVSWLDSNVLIYEATYMRAIDYSSGAPVHLGVFKFGHSATSFLCMPGGARRFFAGTVKDGSGNPLEREVRVIHRATGRIIGSTKSSAVDGKFQLMVFNAQPAIVYAVGTGTEKLELFDSVTPVATVP